MYKKKLAKVIEFMIRRPDGLSKFESHIVLNTLVDLAKNDLDMNAFHDPNGELKHYNELMRAK